MIEPAGGERNPADPDYVVMLNDWTDLDPTRVFAIQAPQPVSTLVIADRSSGHH